MNKRVIPIDIIRAFSIIIVMITHSLALFLGTHFINEIWNYLHFVVPAFVFCSGFVAASSFKRSIAESDLYSWYRKRFLRLYIPYLIYIGLFLCIRPNVVSARFIIESVFLTGGADVGWLPLLFLQLALLTPLYIRISRHSWETGFGILVLIGISFLLFIFRIPPVYSRLMAWIPWSLPYVAGLHFSRNSKHQNISMRMLILAGCVCFALWFLLRQTLISTGQPITLTLHKYPPDIFYILYACGLTSFCFAVIRNLKNPPQLLVRIINYISRRSYELLFLHLLVLQILVKIENAGAGTVLLLSITGAVGILWCVDRLVLFPKNDIPTINKKR
jgi:hypothetical protein